MMTQLATPTLESVPRKKRPRRGGSSSETAKKHLASPWASLAAVVLAVLWTLPTFGLFVTSFVDELQSSYARG